MDEGKHSGEMQQFARIAKHDGGNPDYIVLLDRKFRFLRMKDQEMASRVATHSFMDSPQVLYLMLQNEEVALSAQEALTLGLVHEIVSPDCIQPRLRGEWESSDNDWLFF